MFASSGDTTAPATPANLHVVSASPSGIALAWDAVTGDNTLYGYEVLRSDLTGVLALTTGVSYTDTAVEEGQTYTYMVRAVKLETSAQGACTIKAGKVKWVIPEMPRSAAEVAEEMPVDETGELLPLIGRRKKFIVLPMTEDEALEQMRLLGHDNFFIFFNAEQNSMQVLYRRRNGTYGLIEPVVG